MISCKELRIGNFVNKIDAIIAFDGNVTYKHRLHVITHNVIFHIVEDDDPTHHPIPLTQEWLEKFGFEWHPAEKVYSIQIGNMLYLDFDKDFDCAITPETWLGATVYPWAQIKHVHQLQNLYFALTGEELKLKDQ